VFLRFFDGFFTPALDFFHKCIRISGRICLTKKALNRSVKSLSLDKVCLSY
jgi:hypothetical protein